MANINTVISGWNAVVHLPASYAANPTKKYPTIIFFPGLGEVGTDINKIRSIGPSAYIDAGWNGVTNGVEFIVISLQPPSAYPGRDAVESRLKLLKAAYRIDTTNVFLTGLSHGGGMAGSHVSYSTFYKEVKAVAVYASMLMDWTGGTAANKFNVFDPFALNGGKMLVAEQADDIRYNEQVINRMNTVKAGSGEYYITRFGGAPYGHDSWDSFFGGKSSQPQKIGTDTVYEWFAKQTGIVAPAPNTPPTVNAGIDQTITLPTNSISLTATATDNGTVTYQWSIVSGLAALTNDKSATVRVSSFPEGEVVLKVEVTDSEGLKASDIVKITVLPDPNRKVFKVSGTITTDSFKDKILDIQAPTTIVAGANVQEGDTITIFNLDGFEITYPDGTKSIAKNSFTALTFVRGAWRVYGKL